LKKKLNKKKQARLMALMHAAQNHFNQGRLNQAAQLCQQVLQISPDHAPAMHTLGLIAYQQGATDSALQLLKQAVKRQPREASYLSNLGILYNNTGQPQQAIEHYQRALALEPNCAEFLNNLGVTYLHLEQYQQAKEYLDKSIQSNPGYFDAHNNLAEVFIRQGYIEEAIASFRRAIAIRPDVRVPHAGLLFLLSYYGLCPSDQLMQEHKHWDEIHGAAGRKHGYKHTPPSMNDRRLRIGYVSADFRRHPVSAFIEPLLKGHHKDKVEVFCYADVSKPDAITRRLQGLAEHWLSITGATDAQVAQKINQDGIDILIDLSGHTANNRLAIFTYKAAPIQAGYLGYAASTGLQTMDYWISDKILQPEDTKDIASETLYRLPRCWISYQPPVADLAIKIKATDTPLVYGSFNNVIKLNSELIACWQQILAQSPGAQLLLKSTVLDNPEFKQKIVADLSQAGIDMQRVQLRGGSAYDDYMLDYNAVDIALDTFPRSGGTTAADALWMGVPVVTLAGEHYVQRLATSKLNAIGHPEWIAGSPKKYVDIAVALGKDRAALSQTKTSLRDAFMASELFDYDDLATHMETAYQEMWQAYLNGGVAASCCSSR
jgi:protein O-GlcNAc transferase